MKTSIVLQAGTATAIAVLSYTHDEGPKLRIPIEPQPAAEVIGKIIVENGEVRPAPEVIPEAPER